ncbi:MAG TPA: arginine--tRNA ligase [Tepidisphaeraceae bacterium]|jgi:arginyl-tRNA synthetase|nr:arginine--tRNA ligase [Tepidisphaeraceae bacterium]
MPTIPAQLDRIFRSAIQDAFNLDAFNLACDPQISVSQNEKFGDYQSNAAMGLVKPVGEKTGQKLNPRAIAEEIRSRLKLGDMATEVTIAGPGFINVRLSPAWLATQLNTIVPDTRLGIAPVAEPQTIVVDYSGPNIAKEMHVGHLRSTIIGDAISRVFEFQQNRIIRQNHIGDWGTQFGRVVLAIWYHVLADHLHQSEDLDRLAKRMKEASDAKDEPAKAAVVHSLVELHNYFLSQDPDGATIFEPRLRLLRLRLPVLEKLYQFVSAATESKAAEQEFIGKDSLASLPRLFTTFIQNPKDPRNFQEKEAWLKAREATLETCAEIYAQLGVKLMPQDVRGESDYQDDLPGIVADLKSAGIAVESEGAIVVQVPGYESPLIIKKSDGGYLYGTTDLAAIRYRITKLGARRIVYSHDSRQQQHFNQVFWTARKIGWAKDVTLDYAPFGTMLGEDGKPFKTRTGGTVKLKDLLDEAEDRALRVVTEKQPEMPEPRRRAIAHAAGIGAVKYADLSKDRVSDYVFSFDKMLALDGNTAPYLQYAHARIRSIFRKAAERAAPSAGDAKPGQILLESPFELALAKHILRLGEVIDLVARELKPHHLCAYLYELATRFSGFFENCPVIQSPPPTRESRLALCDLTARTLEVGLDLLGIEHPDQM